LSPVKVRKTLRRLKRMAYLGALTGTVVGIQRFRDQRSAGGRPDSPATWPPLRPEAGTKEDGA
jgi:hypothetical protein